MIPDVVVIGSGPGGSVTASVAAQAGLSVVVLEEGDWVDADRYAPYSLAQMRHQYRAAGLTAALGFPSIAYAEGRGAGGGSEVNSGLYHRPSAALLKEWSEEFAIDDLSERSLEPHAQRIEARLNVSLGPEPARPSVLARGAANLGWAGMEVPRWVTHSEAVDGGPPTAVKQTMTRTFLADALAAGAQLRTGARVERLEIVGDRVSAVRLDTGELIQAHQVVVCAGTIQTAALLLRSGVRHNVGCAFSVHPTVKVLATAAEDINPGTDLEPYQVTEFAPALTLGASASMPGMLAVAAADAGRPAEVTNWRQQAVYYAALRGEGSGRIRVTGRYRDPLVTYALTNTDLSLLRSGLARLLELLLEAGMTAALPSVRGSRPVHSSAEVAAASDLLTRRTAALMSVHLCGSVPMGEDARRCAADSYGRIPGVRNLRVNDASLLPRAPGINPQGTLMAVALRNVTAMLEGDR